MSLDVAGIRDGLKARLATVTGLRAYDTMPDKLDGPGAVVVPAEPFIDYYQASSGGLVEIGFDVALLVPRSLGADRAQTLLDGYLSAGVATSVHDAIRADQTLGGKVSDAVPHTVGGYGTTTVNDVQYVTARLNVKAWTRRS